ncbi:laccase [Epithele typhae]|uniref:laccase n=1 Tax=Epithele typhae TaxID=378194 RepID=UPI0020073C34|nr:laccase [Epithele typhae]KAH9932000.1 laccase [Epithele typhae]
MAKLSLFTPFVTLALLGGALASTTVGPVGQLTLTNKVIAPDGFPRAAVVVNGQSPGPLIVGHKGDDFRLNVVDKLNNHTMNMTTSIHWHGLFQAHTNWADGPAFVTQCPIASGHSFLYDFSVPDQAGTYWYHSHLALQYCDGLRGPLVIYDKHDPLKYLYDVDDESTVITLSEWYHVAATLRGGPPGRADSTLINGLGYSPTTNTGELAVINVTKGKRYRFRLVSISCEQEYTWSIDKHNMTIIEVDGVNSQPHTVDSLEIFVAQRYSFVLTADQPVDNYLIRAVSTLGPSGFVNGTNSAILRYRGAPIKQPPATPAPPSVAPLVETDLHPFTPTPVPGKPERGGVDVAINLVFNFVKGAFFLNDHTFSPPSVPVLLQILSGAQTAQQLMPEGSVIPLPANKTIEVSFPANNSAVGGPHPFHLHGHTFAVVRSAGSSVYNYDNPIFRDTVDTGSQANGDNVTIRFVTDNPGPWFLHCHIDPHLNAGFAVAFAEDIPDIASANPVPAQWKNLCPVYDALPESKH